MIDFLKNVPMFADLPEDDMARLCELVTEELLPAGEMLFIEGKIGDKAYVIKSGDIEILKSSGGRTVLLAVRHAGDVIGEMSLLDQAPRFASGRARTDLELFAISHNNLEHLLDTSPSAARVMLTTVTNRLRNSELVLRQSEKMAQLGTLTAGITHELNNPASAARRGSAQLQVAFVDHQRIMQDAYKLGFSEAQWDELAVLDELARKLAAQPVELSSLGHSDREEEIEEWLDSHGIQNSWDYAPMLVDLGYEPAKLDVLKRKFPAKHLEIVIRWMGSLITIYSLLEEINQGATRIGEIVRSLKSYVYLDQAPVQSIDIHEGLDNTLVMMRSKLKSGILVKREYDAELPRIQGYGSELNQVWTNLIDNAIDAMDGNGTIIIRTQHDNDWVIVEVEDSGPGMPEEIQQKLFSPFFTTKPLGKGTGLGLNISYNIIQKHHGEIKVFSQPGRTNFYVRLPINFDEAQNGYNPLPASPENSDECMLEILETTETIAVVGISNRQSAPAYTVPVYLKKKGYRIIPVNPKFEHVLDEKAYPDLLSVPDPVDTVLIFRRSDYVPEIVEQAIQIGAKAVWMQEEVVNAAAADAAKHAGLEVVMDECMRKTHMRLVEGV